MRSYAGRISEIVVGIKSCSGSKEEDEIVEDYENFDTTNQESSIDD